MGRFVSLCAKIEPNTPCQHLCVYCLNRHPTGLFGFLLHLTIKIAIPVPKYELHFCTVFYCFVINNDGIVNHVELLLQYQFQTWQNSYRILKLCTIRTSWPFLLLHQGRMWKHHIWGSHFKDRKQAVGLLMAYIILAVNKRTSNCSFIFPFFLLTNLKGLNFHC